jgi:cyclase
MIAIAGLVTAWLLLRQPPVLAIHKVADNLFVISGGHDGNTAVFVREGGVVLVDTKSEGNGQRLLDLIKTVTDKPVTHILNTHTHFDHVGSNAYFAEHVEVVAQENTAGQMVSMREFGRPDTTHGLPDRTFKDSLTLFPGPEQVELRFFGAAHTNGDAFIVFRAAGVMHAGDTFPGVNAVEQSGGSEAAYAATMNRAASDISGVTTVIPGHGALATWQQFVDNAAAIRNRQ